MRTEDHSMEWICFLSDSLDIFFYQPLNYVVRWPTFFLFMNACLFAHTQFATEHYFDIFTVWACLVYYKKSVEWHWELLIMMFEGYRISCILFWMRGKNVFRWKHVKNLNLALRLIFFRLVCEKDDRGHQYANVRRLVSGFFKHYFQTMRNIHIYWHKFSIGINGSLVRHCPLFIRPSFSSWQMSWHLRKLVPRLCVAAVYI